jgi:PKD repeat protein
LKAKKHDIRVRELFRRKLGKAEILPSSSVQTKLMRELAFREFMRFIPSRFNIYYLIGLLAAIVTTGLLVFSGYGNHKSEEPVSTLINSDSVSVTRYLDIPAGSPIVSKPDSGKEVTPKASVSKDQAKIITGSNKEVNQEKTRVVAANIVHAGVIDSFAARALASTMATGEKKLRGFSGEQVSLFIASANSGCVPLKLHFTITARSYDSCHWTFGDGGYSNQKDPEWIYDVDGEYKVVLHLFGHDGSEAVSTEMITVYPKPKARFEISPEKAVLPDDRIHFFNYSSNAVKFKWNFGDGTSSTLFEPDHRYSKYSSYDVSLVVYSESGCFDSLVVRNAFSDSEYLIEFPNAFIPNPGGSTGGIYSSKSDEEAQVFHPVFAGVADYQLKIFSKLGVLIFESNDVNIGWDGYFKGQLCNPGVYIWKIRGTFLNGEPFVNMGDVTLLKN